MCGKPLPFNLVKTPEQLAEWLVELDVGTVVIDSLKDVAVPLSSDEVGSAVNLALQHVTAAGIEALVLHHQRKAQADNKKPTTLADVYGSAWITAGAGSVVLLWGQAGDPVIELTHLKSPGSEIGPLKLVHDHEAGRTSLYDPVDLFVLVQAATNGGLTARDAARRIFGVAEPDANQRERMRRRLRKLVTLGHAVEDKGDGPTAEVHYRPVERRHA